MKRAIIIATDEGSRLAPLTNRRPGCLLPVGDKPIIYHILEELVRYGVTAFEIVLHDHPALVEEYLQEGKRWGVTITYHLAKDPTCPLRSVTAAASEWQDQELLVASAKQLINLNELKQALCHTPAPVRVISEGEPTGWFFITTSMLPSLDQPEMLATNDVEISTVFSVHDAKALLDSNQRVLQRQVPHRFQPASSMVDEGVWIGRGVTIHPTAEIRPPVYIGPDTQIHAQTRIGPNALIESDCLVDRGSTIADGLVLSNTFVGEGLEVQQSVVDRHQLVSVALDTAITSTEDHILGDLTKPTLKRLFNQLLERIFATLLVILLSPLVAILIFRYGTQRTPVIHLPTTLNPVGWRAFEWISLPEEKHVPRLFRWLVELLNIVNGHAHFIGIPPRQEQQLSALNSDWKTHIVKAKLGTISPGEAYGQNLDDTDQQFATESLYAAQMRYSTDLKLLLMFLWKTFTFRGGPNAE